MRIIAMSCKAANEAQPEKVGSRFYSFRIVIRELFVYSCEGVGGGDSERGAI